MAVNWLLVASAALHRFTMPGLIEKLWFNKKSRHEKHQHHPSEVESSCIYFGMQYNEQQKLLLCSEHRTFSRNSQHSLSDSIFLALSEINPLKFSPSPGWRPSP